MVEGGVDLGAVLHDASLQLDERGDAAASGPGDPPVERLFAGLTLELERDPQTLLEQVGTVQPGVGLGDPGQLGARARGFQSTNRGPAWGVHASTLVHPSCLRAAAVRASFNVKLEGHATRPGLGLA